MQAGKRLEDVAQAFFIFVLGAALLIIMFTGKLPENFTSSVAQMGVILIIMAFFVGIIKMFTRR